MILNDGNSIDMQVLDSKPSLANFDFSDEKYNLIVVTYNPEFMKMFYNSFDTKKIHSMEINFDFHFNDVCGIHDDNLKNIVIVDNDSIDDYTLSNSDIILNIDDYI